MKTALIVIISACLTAHDLTAHDHAGDKHEGKPGPSSSPSKTVATTEHSGPERFLSTLSFTQAVQSQIAAKNLEAKMDFAQWVANKLQDKAIDMKTEQAISDATPVIETALTKSPSESYVIEVVIVSHLPSGQKRFLEIRRHGLGSTPVAAVVQRISQPSAGRREPGFSYDPEASYVLSFTMEDGKLKVSRLFMPFLRQAVQAELDRLSQSSNPTQSKSPPDRSEMPDRNRDRPGPQKEAPQKEPPSKEPPSKEPPSREGPSLGKPNLG